MLKNKLTSTTWWKGAAERAISQAAEAVIAVILVTSFTSVNWLLVAGVALGGAIWSIVASLASLPEAAGINIPYWKALAYRVTRTIAIALATVISTAVADGVFNALTFDWVTAANTAGLTVFLALTKSLVFAPRESRLPIDASEGE